MSSSILSDKAIFKSLVASACAASIDIVVYKNSNYKATALLAGTVGLSSYASNKLSNMLPDVSGDTFDNNYIDSKTVQNRLLELTLASSGSFVLNKFVFKNLSELPLIQYALIFSSCSFVSEYVTDYAFSEPLNYLR